MLGALAASQLCASTLTVSAFIPTKGQCRFNSTSATLNFGTLNPLDPQDVIVDTDTQLSFSCNGNGQDDIAFLTKVTASAYGTAVSPRMRHQDGGIHLPYELSLSTSSVLAAKKADIELVVTGTVRGSDYVLAPIGSYSDTVTISITP